MVGAFGGAQGLGAYVTATYYNCERPGWHSSYLNCEFDDLFVRASMTVDPQERDEIYGQAVRMFNEDVPQMPLWMPHELQVATKRLGVEVSPSIGMPGARSPTLKPGHWTR